MHENEIQQSGCNFLLCMSTMFSSLVGLNQEDIFLPKRGSTRKAYTNSHTHGYLSKNGDFSALFLFFCFCKHVIKK